MLPPSEAPLWVGHRWPMSPQDEMDFIADLKSTPGWEQDGDPTRDDIIMLLTCLRNGIHASDLVERFPGAKPGRLVSAWELLSRRIRTATTHLRRLLAQPDYQTADTSGPEAARILPEPVAHLVDVLHSDGVRSARRHAELISAKIDVAVQRASFTEQLLHGLSDTWAQSRSHLGKILYHPYRPCLWSDPYYLPSRPGALTPNRLQHLLDEIPAPGVRA